MAAYTANQVSINNGQKNVVVNSNESPAGVSKGDFIHVGTFTPMEINRTYVDSSGKHVIELLKAWGNSNQSNQPAIVIPTTVQFKDTVKALQTANRLLNDNTQAMQDWQTKTGSVTFIDAAGVNQSIKTLKQMQIENDALHPYPWAMRKVEFEANRAANNELYAASGFVHFGNHYAGTDNVNEGLWSRVNTDTKDGLRLGADTLIAGDSKSKHPIVNISGVLTHIRELSNPASHFNNIKFPPAEDGTRTYDKVSGMSITHATPAIAFASETTTNQVVTDRTDFWGFEQFLREITESDPFVYCNGLIQGLSDTINGVATISNTTKPITYFAWFDGDETSRGKGVNWITATEAERIKIASDPSNKILYDDSTGKFYQSCLRGRSFAGLGNEDPNDLTPRASNGVYYVEGTRTIQLHGIKDSVTKSISDLSSGSAFFSGHSNFPPQGKEGKGVLGAFFFQLSTDGECYFLPCGTVNRLNKGAYHPSFNPRGVVGMHEAGVAYHKWFANHPWNITSKASMFSYSWDHVKGSGSVEQGENWLGRPDKRFYDAIYAKGQGGVSRDMRYSAWGITNTDIAHADLRVKSGTFLGKEPLQRVKLGFVPKELTKGAGASVLESHASSGVTGKRLRINVTLLGGTDGTTFNVNNKANQSRVYIVGGNGAIYEFLNVSYLLTSNGYTFFGLVLGSDESIIAADFDARFPSGTTLSIYTLTSEDTNSDVVGEFTHMEVIGSPANILQCDDLKGGWVGSWNPEIPNSTSKTYALSRKASSSFVNIVETSNLGATWSESPSVPISNITNSFSRNIGASAISVLQYWTNAKITKDADNSPVHGGVANIGRVYATSFYATSWGSDFIYSTTGKIATYNQSSNKLNSEMAVKDLSFRHFESKLEASNGRETTHEPVTIGGSIRSQAVKALSYPTTKSGLVRLNYAYTEIRHNGTDWGDDSRLHIADNQSSMLDTNGQRVLTGTAQAVEPIGWIKNDK